MAYREMIKRPFSYIGQQLLNECQITRRIPDHEYFPVWAQYIRDNYPIGSVYIVIRTDKNLVKDVKILSKNELKISKSVFEEIEDTDIWVYCN